MRSAPIYLVSALLDLGLMSGCAGDSGSGPHDTGAELVADVTADVAPDAAPDLRSEADRPVSTARAKLDFGYPDSLFDAPFPSGPAARTPSAALPNPAANGFVRSVWELAVTRDGFGQSAPIFFPFDGALDPATLPPDVHASLDGDATAFLVDIERCADGPSLDVSCLAALPRAPIDVSWRPEGTDYAAPNLVVFVPHPGAPLRPGARYAAVITTGVHGADGAPLPAVPAAAVGPALDALGPDAAAVEEALRISLGARDVGIASLTAFRTGDATATLRAVVGTAAGPRLAGAPALSDVYDAFCVYHATADVPVYQAGTPPYDTVGGAWAFDPDGTLIQQGTERANVWITIPRGAASGGDLDTVVFVRTGGGGDRPLVDRGLRSVPLGPTEPGSGPANALAEIGWAGFSIDGPHGGARNVSGRDEQILIFNITNPAAMRDNIRQSALELALVPALLDTLVLDTSDCPGAGVAGTQTRLRGSLALLGHSMGATIAPLVAAVQPRYEALILSGAGGSWIENVMYKESPLPVRPLAELVLRVPSGTLRRDDPVLGMLQWAGEVADPPLYARVLAARRSPDILMFQGIVDTYILPPVANALSLSLGLDLGGAGLERDDPRLEAFATLASLLPLSGRAVVPFPVSANVVFPGTGAATRVVVQHRQDAIEDGHEVMFQLDAPHQQLQTFLSSRASGAPQVPDGVP